MEHGDRVQRFLFEGAPVRGGLVQLDLCWREVLARRAYPAPVRAALGELTAASALLVATLKFEGALVLQLQGEGPLRLLVVECASDLSLRATARFDADALPDAPASLGDLSGGGRCAITLDLRDGRPTYQGVVPLEGATTAEVLEGYMTRSEQLDTRFVLCADGQRAAGLLVQRLPGASGQLALPGDERAWEAVCARAREVDARALLSSDGDETLRRLFGGHDLRLFESLPVRFRCGCTRAKVARLLRLLGKAEVRAVLAERGSVEVTCDFCHLGYAFDPAQAEEALRAAADDQPLLRLA